MRKIYFILIANCLLLIANCYSQPVTQEWVRRFTNGNYANGFYVNLDSFGNLYVLTANPIADSTNGDYCVLKYSSVGTLLWSTYYNSPGNLSDQPVAFSVTGGGDVYVTGLTSVNFVHRVTTVKFNSNGVFKWARQYNGGGPTDDVSDIKVDHSGNVIVIGTTMVSNNMGYCLTIKYNPYGDSIWVKKLTQLTEYSSGWRAAIDVFDNIYVEADYGNNNADYLAFKYALNGDLLWYVTYDSPQHYGDLTWALDIDTNKNIYVLGTNSVPTALANNTLLKINSSGSIQWAKVFTGIAGVNSGCGTPAGVATTLDGSSIYYTTTCANGNGAGGYDIVTLKYNTTGDTQWVRRYAGEVTSNRNYPSAINLDFLNNVYVTGTQNNLTSGDDYVTIKYLSDGTRQWVASYNGPLSSSFDDSHDLVIDKNMNVYITGISSRLNSTPILWDAATIKYNQPNGINSNTNELPARYKLLQNYPNPFNSITVITYELPRRSNVILTLYNITGQLVRTLVNTEQNTGYYSVAVNMDDLASGVYFYKIEVRGAGSSTGFFIDTKKLVLVK